MSRFRSKSPRVNRRTFLLSSGASAASTMLYACNDGGESGEGSGDAETGDTETGDTHTGGTPTDSTDSTLTGPDFPDPDAPLPNVLLLTGDDLGWLSTGIYGNEHVYTPAIDRIGREGILFENAFNVTSSCSPSRTSLATGQYPHTHGAIALTHVSEHVDKAIPPDYPTLVRALNQAGYRTGLHGKWHIAPFADPSEFGYTDYLNSGGHAEQFSASTKDIAFLESVDGPFYHEINYLNTHRTLVQDPAFPVDPADIVVPQWWALPDWPEIRECVASYYSQLMKMDQLIGDVLDSLEQAGVLDQTIIVFISDNGVPFPGNKKTLYDRGTGTPLLIRYPPAIDAGSVCASPVVSIDVLPTVAELVGLPIDEGVQGLSLTPLLEAPDGPPLRDAVFSEMTYHRHYQPMRAVRGDGFKYIRNLSDDPVGLGESAGFDWAQALLDIPGQRFDTPRPREELYDLQADPTEQDNLVDNAAVAETLDDLRARLRAHAEETEDTLFLETD